MIQLAIVLSGVLAASLSAAGLAPDPARVNELADLLPPAPRGVGRPITDRDAWSAMASAPGFEGILRQARAAMERPLPPLTDDVYLDYSRTGNRSRGQRVIRERHSRFPLLTLAECIENRGRYLPAIEAAIREVCTEKTWLLPAHDGGLGNFKGSIIQIDLESSAASWNMATAYDWLGDRLSGDVRTLIQNELDRRTFRPFESCVTAGQPRLWWVTGTNNWNAVCLAGVTGAALAAIDSRQRRGFFVAAAEKSVQYFLRGFTPDGYCSEGLGYWNYGFGHYVLLAETIHAATDGKVDLFSDPRVAAIARFGSRMEILPGVYPAFADCGTNTRPDSQLMAFLGRRLRWPGEGADAAAMRRPSSRLFTTGIYAFPNSATRGPVPGEEAPDRELRDWFPDAGILICRPAPGRQASLGVALKGGHNGEHHNHNDVGSFVVALAGETPLLDPGSEVYTARTFSGRRYESNVLNSFGHPVPRVAGHLQQTGRGAAARVIRTEFTDRVDTLVLDLRAAYDVRELGKLERTFIFSREAGGSLSVIDEVEFTTPKEFETALITPSKWRQVAPGRLVVGTGPGAVEVTVDTGKVPLAVHAEEIREDVRGEVPTRVGLKLTEPVTRAIVRCGIRPAPQASSP